MSDIFVASRTVLVNHNGEQVWVRSGDVAHKDNPIVTAVAGIFKPLEIKWRAPGDEPQPEQPQPQAQSGESHPEQPQPVAAEPQPDAVAEPQQPAEQPKPGGLTTDALK